MRRSPPSATWRTPRAGRAAVDAFVPRFFNGLVLQLDYSFVHRTRNLEGKDGNPLNEVRVLCSSLFERRRRAWSPTRRSSIRRRRSSASRPATRSRSARMTSSCSATRSSTGSRPPWARPTAEPDGVAARESATGSRRRRRPARPAGPPRTRRELPGRSRSGPATARSRRAWAIAEPGAIRSRLRP